MGDSEKKECKQVTVTGFKQDKRTDRINQKYQTNIGRNLIIY